MYNRGVSTRFRKYRNAVNCFCVCDGRAYNNLLYNSLCVQTVVNEHIKNCFIITVKVVHIVMFPTCYFFLRSTDALLTQYLSPVGIGPSSNTCPKCESHLLHLISTRRIPCELSAASATASLMADE